MYLQVMNLTKQLRGKSQHYKLEFEEKEKNRQRNKNKYLTYFLNELTTILYTLQAT